MPRVLDAETTADLLRRSEVLLEADRRFHKVSSPSSSDLAHVAQFLCELAAPVVLVDGGGNATMFEPGDRCPVPAHPEIVVLVSSPGAVWLTKSGALCLAGVLTAAH